MESIKKKAGYLEGLVSAMQLDDSEPQARLLNGIVSLLSELADRTEALDDMFGELNDYVESIDDDLSELEGMHDDEDGAEFDDEDFEEYGDFEAEEPLRLIRNASDNAPKSMRIPAMCPNCKGLYLATAPIDGRRYTCPLCQKAGVPTRISEDNTPTAEPEED